MFDLELRELPRYVPILLDNETCPYCGIYLGIVKTIKEHVIGRRFVPKGKLNGQWNLIVRACVSCNKRKGDLENDLSAITMQPDAWGQYALSDQVLSAEAARKGQKSISRRTNKPVSESSEMLEIEGLLAPGIKMTLNMMSPPQADSFRVFELARLHVMAFFYWVTYDCDSKIGGFWPGSFFPILEAPRSDWGNPVHRAFMDAVVDWEPRVLAKSADGFFKIVIRRHPTAVCWSWALEWNYKLRIVGFFGEQEPAETVASTFPGLEIMTLATGLDSEICYRRETGLADGEDKLFFRSLCSLPLTDPLSSPSVPSSR